MTTAAGRALTVGEVRQTLAGIPDNQPFTIDGEPVMDLDGANVITDREAIITDLCYALEQIANARENKLLKIDMIELAKEALS